MPKSAAECRFNRALIESDSFDFEFLSEIGQRESWRKELFRPVYHLHKWWANRLGSVFRGVILGAMLPEDANLEDNFYRRHSFAGRRILDPFMGSGTTIGEAHKLGFVAFGQDINPVACESVRVALGEIDPDRAWAALRHLEAGVGQRIRQLYSANDAKKTLCDVLYYFWVKTVPCPHCGGRTDLFSSRIIARHANPSRKPEVQVCCPGCGDVFRAGSRTDTAKCPRCSVVFAADSGTAARASATCPRCSREFAIAKAVRATGQPPGHRLYAKLLLAPSGRKVYLPATEEDLRAYEQCSAALERELQAQALRLPETMLEAGHNTKQALSYNYRQWRQFFNDRQLLALGWLQRAISELPDRQTRDVLMTLFSGLLEFNNLFASYKGEGTGAVRHMFSHYILKPERMPIEANVWGTPRSSGSFVGLFKSRLLRAAEYRNHPFELDATTGEKVFGASREFAGRVVSGFPADGSVEDDAVYVTCGSSDRLALSDGSIDLVVTDPPFFDNVHYSELADFFYSWQVLYPHGFVNGAPTTRHASEVQDGDADRFADKLGSVLKESARVLRDNGLLVFSYHHSRADGWSALLSALTAAELHVVNAHPVKAEMSVAAPKSQAKEPIQLDVIIVCRKTAPQPRPSVSPRAALDAAGSRAVSKIDRLRSTGLVVSRNDCRVVLMGQLLAELCPLPAGSDAPAVCAELEEEIGRRLDSMMESFSVGIGGSSSCEKPVAQTQLSLFDFTGSR